MDKILSNEDKEDIALFFNDGTIEVDKEDRVSEEDFLKILEKVVMLKLQNRYDKPFLEIIEQVSKIDSFKKIPSLKKLVGFENASRQYNVH